jgi:hypothetical protein
VQHAAGEVPPQQQSISKLELQGRYALHGVIESMAMLKSRSPDIQRDALMLAFRSVWS